MVYFQDLLTFLQNQLVIVNKQLESVPEGGLLRTVRNEKITYFHDYNRDSKRHRKSITKDPAMQRALARKEYLSAKRRVLINNVRLLERVRNEYIEVDFNNIFPLLKKSYRQLPTEYFFGEQEGNWEKEDYERSAFKPEAKLHVTSRGLKIRSKSELIIAECLYEKGISFRYEQILTIGYKKFAPDFTVKRHDGKIIYWEHCGLTNDRRYMAGHMKKLASYYEAGIVPWKNLIVTYDDDDGALNIEIIKSEIRNKLLRGV